MKQTIWQPLLGQSAGHIRREHGTKKISSREKEMFIRKEIQLIAFHLKSKYIGRALSISRPQPKSLPSYDHIGTSKRLRFTESTRFVGPTVTNRQSTTAAAVNTQSKTKKKMAKLTEQERAEVLQPLLNVGWSMVNGRDAIYKEYLFSDFNQAFSFMSGVALLAEKTNHHPEWFNVYNKVQVTMSTHDVGGLSAKDIRMAKYMEEQAKRFL